MTVTYTAEVSTCKKFGCFIKLLARWRGSIYKIIWLDLLLYLALYYCINLIYFNLLENESKRTFESVVYYCSNYTGLIPLSFVLGFYVTLVMTRWWEQYTTIPWPDSIAVFVSAHVHGQDEGGRLMRRTVMRYVCLCLTIVFTMISPCVKKRFPKMKNLVDAGLLLENEKPIIEAMDSSFPNYPKHWMPIVWAASIITRARKEGRIRDDFAVKTIIDELNSFRGRCGTLMYYDFISIPLVYTQVVTIAVYSFFVCSLLAHQWTETKKDTFEALDFYSPVFITLQFFFYMGWLKVAETLINPFGDDDDDFEVNWMIDRNLQVSYLIVDEMHNEHPDLVRDQYWDEVYPNELPYENEIKREQPPEPSTAKYDLEDSPKHPASRLPSHVTSATVSEKTFSSIRHDSSRRSQRFNEKFKRFLHYSQENATSSRTHMDNDSSFPSVSDIENIEHITSYTYSGNAESQLESEHIKETSTLEVIVEEAEAASELVEEEEMPNFEEEEGDFETQSEYEDDSDSDPFERLRIERQQQRMQRMNDYLQRYFGTNYRMVEQFSAASVKESTTKTVNFRLGENNENRTLNNLLTPTISTDYIKLDLKSYSPLENVESDEKLLTPKISNASLVQNKSSVALKNTVKFEKLPHEETIIRLEDDQAEVHSKPRKTDDAEVKANILKNSSVPAKQPVSFEQQVPIKKISRLSITQTIPSTSRVLQPDLLEQGSHVTKTQDVPYSSPSENSFAPEQGDRVSIVNTFVPPLETRSKIYVPQEQKYYKNIKQELPSASKIVDQSSSSNTQEASVYNFQNTPRTASETRLIIPTSSSKTNIQLYKGDKSKETSPLGSARSVSTQSSLADDWEILPSKYPSVTGEYRVEIEDTSSSDE